MSKQAEVKSLTPQQAYQMLQDDPRAVLVDVRSSMEYLFVGHPKGSIHIPWIDEPEWKINPDFATEVRKLILGGASCVDPDRGCAPVLLICRSGVRSLEAGKALIRDGFEHVYNVRDGFEGPLDDEHHRSTQAGWRYEGLPWEQC
jgi:rhodanese-related sulfurtransferase